MRRIIFADKVLILPTIFFAAYVYTFGLYNSETGELNTLAEAPAIIGSFFTGMITYVWIWLRMLDISIHGRVRFSSFSSQ